MAGANGIPTAATGLADLWPFECAAAAAKVAPGWNKKSWPDLLTNRISLDIFGYIRGGNVPAPKNEGKQMNRTTFNTTFELDKQIPTKKILITYYVLDLISSDTWNDYVIKDFFEQKDYTHLVNDFLSFKENYMNSKYSVQRYRVKLHNYLIIEHREV